MEGQSRFTVSTPSLTLHISRRARIRRARSTAITGTLYVHLLRSARQKAAGTVAVIPGHVPACPFRAHKDLQVFQADRRQLSPATKSLAKRRAWDSNPRRGSLPVAVFKTAAIGH